MIGTKLAVEEEVCDASCEEEEDSEKEIEEGRTRWEEMHDIYFKKPILFSRGVNSSVESLMEDEENCALNLSKMYGDENNERNNSVQIKIEVDDEKSVENTKNIDDDKTLDVIDDLLKSFEKEVDGSFEAVPILAIDNE